jgi:hypothetical protein
MNFKFIPLYFLLVFIYLILSNSLSPEAQKMPQLRRIEDLQNMPVAEPYSMILIDQYQVGFFVHTYFQKYRIISPFQGIEEITFQTSKDFWETTRPFLGMAIVGAQIQRKVMNNKSIERIIATPPGSLFIGDHAYGFWNRKNEKVEPEWEFHRRYQYFTYAFHWGTFRPTPSFYKQMKEHLSASKTFFGTNNEFGLGGTITSSQIKIKHYQPLQFSWNKIYSYMKRLVRRPLWFKGKD